MTLASENNRKPPSSVEAAVRTRGTDRLSFQSTSGASAGASAGTSKRSPTETIPPTLLHLPDLEAEFQFGGGSPTDREIDRVVQGREHNQDTDQRSCPNSSAVKSESTSSSGPVAAAHFLPPGVQVKVATPPPANAVETVVAPLAVGSNPPLAARTFDTPVETSHRSDSPSTWLVAMASRKSLLILLAIIAALAIFMPRGENASSEQKTPLMVDEATATNSKNGGDAMVGNAAARTTLMSPVASLPRSKGSNASGLPVIREAPAASVTITASNAIPVPPYRSESKPSEVRPSETVPFVQWPGPSKALAMDQDFGPVGGLGADAVETRFFPIANEIRNHAHEYNQVPPPVSDPPARLVNSRTPHQIVDWKKYLPPIDWATGDSATGDSATGDSLGASSFGTSAKHDSAKSGPGSAVAGTVETDINANRFDIRASESPSTPDFQFALPDDAAASQPRSDPPSVTPSVTPSVPEARVAMPPRTSLR